MLRFFFCPTLDLRLPLSVATILIFDNMRNLFLLLLLLPVLGSAQIKWMSIEEAAEANAKEPKKIFIDVYTDWCGWCKRMDASTFKDSAVAALINSHFYAVKLNAEGKDSIVLNGTTFRYVEQGRKGYHELAVALLQGKMSYPTMVYLDEQFNMIQPIPGYQNPEQLLPILEYLGMNHHKDTPWETFQKAYAERKRASSHPDKN